MLALISIKLAIQTDTSTHCKTMDMGRISNDVPVCSTSFCWVLMQPTHRGIAQAEVDMDAWFCTEVVYLSKDVHRSRH